MYYCITDSLVVCFLFITYSEEIQYLPINSAQNLGDSFEKFNTETKETGSTYLCRT